MKRVKIFSIAFMLILSLALTACGETDKPLTNVGAYNDYTLELLDANVDDNTLKVDAIFTNKGAEPNYALSGFATRAFQNGKELTATWEVANDHNLTTEIKDGQSINVTFYFELQDRSEVEVLIGEPTAERKTVGKQTYKLEE